MPMLTCPDCGEVLVLEVIRDVLLDYLVPPSTLVDYSQRHGVDTRILRCFGCVGTSFWSPAS